MKQRRLTVNQKRKLSNKDIVNVELDINCCCPQSISNNDASIQFTRRYLQCQSSMPIRIIRLFIETILPHAPIVKVFLFDSNNRLLRDCERLYSLKHTYSSSNYIPLRFTLLNTVTSFPHCSCLLPPIKHELSSLPTIIQLETIEQILSTCSIIQRISSISPCLSSSPPPPPYSIELCNPLTPSPFLIDCEPDETIIDQITSEYGEICPPSPKSEPYLLDIPLDLTIKKHSLSYQN